MQPLLARWHSGQVSEFLRPATAALMEGEEEVGVSGVVLLELVHVLRNEPYLQTNPEAGARLLLDSIKASA